LERCLAEQPDNARALGALGLLMLGEDRADEALTMLLAALEVDYGQASLIPHAVALARGLGRADELIERLGAYADYYTGDFDSSCTYAELLMDLGRADEARQRIDTVLMFEPDHAQALALQGRLDGEVSG
jgi:predicted Zn-dependent protease